MRSGTSFFDWTTFKKTVLRFWPVWTAYSVIWAVALPLNAMMLLRLEAEARPGLTGAYMESFAHYTVPGMSSMSLVLAAVFGALAAMAVCSHLYNARSANFFGALPVTREGLFVTHYLAGLAFTIVPNAAIFLLTLLAEAAGGAVGLGELLFWLGVTCGECLFFYSMAVFCGMFTGHILALPAFYGIFNILAYGVYVLVTSVFRNFFYGFSGFESGTGDFVRWLTPILKLESSVYLGRTRNGGIVTQGTGTVAAYAAVAVALTAAAFFLYRVRRLESAGDVVSVGPMKPVFKYGVALCAGLALGMATASVLGGGEVTLMVSMLVWAVAGYFIAQMLLDKSFRVFRKWKGAAAVAGVFILLFLAVGFDLTGFETKVPTADQVDYVEFDGPSLHYLGDDGDYNRVDVSDEKTIELILGLHRAAVAQRDGYQYQSGDTTRIVSLDLVYHLKGGSTLTRYYTMYVDTDQVDEEGSAAWGIQQMYNDRDLYWRIYGFDTAEQRVQEEGFWLEQAIYENYSYEEAYREDPTQYYYGKDAEAIYEAVKEDFKAGRIGVRTVGGEDNNDGRRNVQFRFVDSEGRVYHMNITVQDTASSTLAALEQAERVGPNVPVTVSGGMEPAVSVSGVIG